MKNLIYKLSTIMIIAGTIIILPSEIKSMEKSEKVNLLKPEGIVGSIDINKDDVFTSESFKELIEEAKAENSPFIIAKVKSIDLKKNKTYEQFYNAPELMVYLTQLTGSFILSPKEHRYNTSRQDLFKDPLTRQPIIDEIEFYKYFPLENVFRIISTDRIYYSIGKMNTFISVDNIFLKNTKFNNYAKEGLKKLGIDIDKINNKSDLINTIKNLLLSNIDKQLAMKISLILLQDGFENNKIKELINNLDRDSIKSIFTIVRTAIQNRQSIDFMEELSWDKFISGIVTTFDKKLDIATINVLAQISDVVKDSTLLSSRINKIVETELAKRTKK